MKKINSIDYGGKVLAVCSVLGIVIPLLLASKSKDEIKGTIDEELWEVIYYALAIANIYGIDMEHVIEVKSRINESRYPSEITFEIGR